MTGAGELQDLVRGSFSLAFRGLAFFPHVLAGEAVQKSQKCSSNVVPEKVGKNRLKRIKEHR